MDTSEQSKKNYQKLVKEISPNSPLVLNCIKAFFSGGLICAMGQCIIYFFNNRGFSQDTSALYTSTVLIFAASLLTGLGLYSKLGKHCGSGTIVPITGFSNSVTSPALEYKKEGFIFGMAAKMFIIAGPVIVYGIISSVIVGICYYIGKFYF